MISSTADTSVAPPLWRRALPFVLGALLVSYVARRIDFSAFAAAVQRTNYPAFVAFAVAFSVALLAADVFATRHVYRRAIGPVKYGELFTIRAASYLPSMLNHHVGQAWMTYFLSRAYQTPIARAAGATLLVYATTFGALFAFLLVGLPLNHGRTSWLLPTVVIVATAGLVYLITVTLRPRVLSDRAFTAPLLEAGVRGHLLAVLFRLPHVLVLFLGAWGSFLFFGVHVPLADALALVPVILFAVALPVSPQGIGTRDAMSIALLSSYAAGTSAERAATIAATTLSWLVVIAAIQLVISLIFMRRASGLLGRDVPGSPAP